MSVWLGIELANSVHLQEHITRAQECPTRALLPLLVLLLISDGGTRHTTESTLNNIFFNKDSNIFFCIPDCLATLRHPLPGQLRAADLPYKANSLFHVLLGITLITSPTWCLPNNQLSSHMESSLMLSQCWQIVAVSLFQLRWVYTPAALGHIIQYCPCS